MSEPSIEKIGPYQILGVLHPGPRKLFRARTADGRQVALKTVSLKGLDQQTRERFMREAEICRELSHPNLVRVYDSGEADGFLYQAMELLHGADLCKILTERRPLSWEEKLSWMEQACEGLSYAHSRNLIHRDIKPSNLFVETSGRVRILDFGMARVEASALTCAGMAVGTLTYMAPEQIRGETCTAATDVFAAGIVFYELSTGKHPFTTRGSSMSDILTAALFQAPPPLKEAAPDAPDGLDLVLSKALEKDPAGRLQSADDFKQALSLCKVTLKLRRPPASPVGATAAGSEPIDPAKTVVVPRAARPAPPPPHPAPRPPEPSPKPTPKLDLTFCPACTHGNPKTAQVCAKCGAMLVALRFSEADGSDSRLQWTLIAVIVIGLLLVLALIIQR